MRSNIGVRTVANLHGRIKSIPRLGGLAVVTCCLMAGTVCLAQSNTAASLNGARTVPAQSHLSNVVQWALSLKAPVGLVVKERGELCSPGKLVSLSDRTSFESLGTVLSDTRYRSSISEEVVQIIPLDLEEDQARILETQFGTFHSIRTSMNSLGVILSGWLFAKIHPGVGYGGNLTTSDSSEMIAPFMIENPTLVQIANHIVALGGKGLWILILHRDSNDSRQSKKDPTFGIYSYHDDVKAISKLEALVCESSGQ